MKKSILFIGTKYMNYPEAIMNEFSQNGYSIDYFEDRPAASAWFRGVSKLRPNLVQKITDKYFANLLNQISVKKYSLIFIINGKSYNKSMVDELKRRQPQAEFVFWAWDSIENDPQIKKIAPLFDRAYSFDFVDCEQNDYLYFLPFFYTKSLDKLDKSSRVDFDLMYIGTALPNRYWLLKEIFGYLDSLKYKTFLYMFMTKLQFLYYKITDNTFKHANAKDFKFNTLSSSQYFEKLKVSKAVFDVVRLKQTGTTARTIETLGVRRKLITNSPFVSRYDFYNENNIFILAEDNKDKIKDFLQKDFVDIPNEVYRKYHISHFIDVILRGIDESYCIY